MAQEDSFISVNEFIHIICKIFKNTNSKRRIFFLLGAGASVEAGIASAGKLASNWLDEMKIRNGKATADFISKEGIDEGNPAQSYSKIYERRFKDDADERWEYLEEVIDRKTPNYGYSVLSQIVGTSNHNVIITTNFDHLAEQSIHTFTGKTPLVCGHESLAHFARPSNTRPLIIKVHNDLLFAPKNEAAKTEALEKSWEEPFSKLFSNNDQIVLIAFGYGGNDGSLMQYLSKIPKLSNLLWCLYKDEQPSPETLELMKQQNGKFVRTDGFDKTMLRLQNVLEFDLISGEIEKKAKQNADDYRKTYEKLSLEIKKSDDEELKEAQKEITQKTKTKDWFYYELKAQEAKTLEEKDKWYREGLEVHKEEPALIGNYALFLHKNTKDFDEAERLFIESLKLDPNEVNNLGNYANFLSDIRKDFDQAEFLYKKILEIDPYNSNNLGNYAGLIKFIRKDYNLVERFYKRSLELDPSDSFHTGNYASFLSDVRKDFDKAERLYKKSLELDPSNSFHMGNYANFLSDIRNDFDEAEQLYKKALKLTPNDTRHMVNYAIFLKEIRKDFDESERLYKKALELDPNNAKYIGTYAIFLHFIRKDFNEAEQLFKKALELDPNDANPNANYAQLLIAKGEKETAAQYLLKAMENSPKDDALAEIHFYRYANYPEHRKESLPELKRLIKEGVRSPGWDFSPNIELAEKEGHPDLPLLKRLADIISNDAPAEDF